MEKFLYRAKMLFMLLFVACSFVLVSELVEAQDQGPIIARVVFFRNQVTVERGDIRPALAINAPLFRGDIIKTGPNSSISIRMQETRSEFLVKQNTNYELKTKDRHRLSLGSIFAKIKRRGRSEFVLESPTAVASVSGTRFNFDMFGVTATLVVLEPAFLSEISTVEFTSGGVTRTLRVEFGGTAQISIAVGNSAPAPPTDAPPEVIDVVIETGNVVLEGQIIIGDQGGTPVPTPTIVIEPTPTGTPIQESTDKGTMQGTLEFNNP